MTIVVSPARGCALDPAWPAEPARLTTLTSLYDPTARRLREQLGVAESRRCLDVGAGTGTVAGGSRTLLAAGLVARPDLDAFHQLWHDGTTICFAPVMISTWGRAR
jgi:hypothetical protein